MNFTYQFRKKSAHCIVALDGNLLDKESATAFLSEIDNFIANEQNSFVVDLSRVQHINSSGLSVLISILTKARNAGGDVIISNVPEKIKPLLITTKLNTVFTVTNNNKMAEGALKEVVKEVGK